MAAVHNIAFDVLSSITLFLIIKGSFAYLNVLLFNPFSGRCFYLRTRSCALWYCFRVALINGLDRSCASLGIEIIHVSKVIRCLSVKFAPACMRLDKTKLPPLWCRHAVQSESFIFNKTIITYRSQQQQQQVRVQLPLLVDCPFSLSSTS